jgi:hypothetical protein
MREENTRYPTISMQCGLSVQGPENVFPFLKWATKQKQWQHKDTLDNFRGRIERQWIMRRQTVSPLYCW